LERLTGMSGWHRPFARLVWAGGLVAILAALQAIRPRLTGTAVPTRGPTAVAPDAYVMPNCCHVCSTPSDCALGNSLHDADNYQCTANLCRWTGCNNTAECVAGFNDNDYVCE
jgi:hypothetical protein